MYLVHIELSKMKIQRKKSKITKKSGLPPGSLVHIGEQKVSDNTNILIEYNGKEFTSNQLKDLSNLVALDSKNPKWIKVVGLHDIGFIEDLQNKLKIHPLIMEDVLNTQIRSKVELIPQGVFLSIRHLFLSEEEQLPTSENISFILMDNLIVSFQEQESTLYSSFIKRLIDGVANPKNKNIDYFFYRLIDIVIDEYFVVIEDFNERIERLEEKVLNDLSEDQKNEIQLLRGEIINKRLEINPVKEAIVKLAKDPPEIINDSTLKYFLDIEEHIIQIKESIDYQREMVSSVMEFYQIGMGNKMNEVMKTLTFIATIFIPLSFVAGLYGMNFEYMPELGWDYGYFIILGLMASMIVIMLFYFKRKNWF